MSAGPSSERFGSAIKRFEAWWAGSSLGRPAVYARTRRPDAPPMPDEGRPRRQREHDPAFHAARARWMLDAFDYHAEAIPGFYPDFANNLTLPAALAGSELEYRPETTWMGLVPDIYERGVPAFDPAHPIVRLLDEALAGTAAAIGDRGLLSPPVLLDGLTTLSMLRGAEALCMDLFERPADVLRTSAELDRLAFQAHAFWWRTLERLGQAQTVTWAGIYAAGKCEMVQCDFAVNLSPEMFGRFVLPRLAEATRHFEYSCYHLDGVEQCRFLDQLCSLPRLNAIQWNPEPPAAPPLAWVEFFQAVRQRGRSLQINCDADTAVALTERLGPDGMLFSVRCKTADEVARLLERLEKASA